MYSYFINLVVAIPLIFASRNTFACCGKGDVVEPVTDLTSVVTTARNPLSEPPAHLIEQKTRRAIPSVSYHVSQGIAAYNNSDTFTSNLQLRAALRLLMNAANGGSPGIILKGRCMNPLWVERDVVFEPQYIYDDRLSLIRNIALVSYFRAVSLGSIEEESYKMASEKSYQLTRNLDEFDANLCQLRECVSSNNHENIQEQVKNIREKAINLYRNNRQDYQFLIVHCMSFFRKTAIQLADSHRNIAILFATEAETLRKWLDRNCP